MSFLSGSKEPSTCFIYDIDGIELSKKPDWWDSLEYVSLGELKPEQIGMAGERVLKRIIN